MRYRAVELAARVKLGEETPENYFGEPTRAWANTLKQQSPITRRSTQVQGC
jgi:hypothetical protein